MKIIDILKRDGRAFSFEFFPPKDEDGMGKLYVTVNTLKTLRPSFVSVTYGAGGSTRAKTVTLVEKIKSEIGIESMAHLTCVGHTREELFQILTELKDAGVENVLALRGDPPKGETIFVKPEGGFEYASELVSTIREHFDFCIGVAGYPEGHVECPDKQKDLEHLKIKVEAGADFIITQLFFNNEPYLRFADAAQKIGIHTPIIPGIMPITNFQQIKRFASMCGATIPKSLHDELENVQENTQDVEKIGIEYATKQCDELLRRGVPGIHFYTLNKSTATKTIFENLSRSWDEKLKNMLGVSP